MKIINYILAISAVISMLSMPASAEPDPNFHIYLMIGQSNMEGAATIEAQDRVTNSRVMVLQDENCSMLGASYGQWRVASPPLIRCLGNLGLGPGDTFGKTMADHSDSNVTIGLVGAAYGGQKIEYFLKNCDAYNACAPSFGSTPNNFHGGYAWLLDLAKKAQQKGVIKGVIFHQGESNTGDQNWPSRVNQLVTDLRNDLGIRNVPFIAGELPYTGCCSSHNTLIRQLPSIISNAHYVTAEGLNIHDEYHWDSAGVREMGYRYANKMLQLVDTSGIGDNSEIDNGGDKTIIVRMKGLAGSESVSLQVGGATIDTWTANTYMTDYSVNTNATGEIRVVFNNDDTGRDVQVDYIVVNGVVRQAEDQNDNTGAWGNGTCGGTGYSEWLHCNGSIGFGNLSTTKALSSGSDDLDTSPDSNNAGYALNDGRYNIVSSLSGMYMDVYGHSLDNGAKIIQYRQNGGINQQFDVQALADGTYTIRPAHSGKSLDVFNGNADDGAELRQETYTGTSSQRWHIDNVENGLYSITSAFSNKVVDVSEMSNVAGADIKLYSWSGGANQLWSFVPVG
ncbi:MAG: sialate O-acetylesterase, partial [Candidatus Thiodiazotropha sp.]